MLLAQAAVAECPPEDVPGKHGTPNVYRVPVDGDGRGKGIFQSILVTFRMFDDGRIEASLRYDNATQEPFCAGIHIRLDDIHNKALADFYSNPYWCASGHTGAENAEASVGQVYNLSLTTTAEVACNYAHLYIEPNYSHQQTPDF